MRVRNVLTSVGFWCAVCLLLAGVQGYAERHFMNPDGISYMDMASDTLRDGPHHLVNGYWSPAYPALIAASFFVFRPGPGLEFPVVHLLNFAIFVFALVSFVFFIKCWRKDAEPLFIPFCFCVFICLVIDQVGLANGTPDLFVAGVLFLAAGICCSISLPNPDLRLFAVLGFVLALGYYTKAAMMPLGLILLALLFVWPGAGGHKRFKVGLAALLFLILSAPEIILVSSRLGHPSIGDSGRLNYLWNVNGGYLWKVKYFDEVQGKPDHPPRVILESPRILESADPIQGTLPVHDDPSYWWAGVKEPFVLRAQLSAFKRSLRTYLNILAPLGGLLLGAVVFLVFAVRRGLLSGILRSSEIELRWLIAWSVAACLMYAIVVVEPRYVGGFLVLFWLALYRFLWSAATADLRSVILATVTCTLVGTSLVSGGTELFKAMRSGAPPPYIATGEELKAAGIQPGDRLATVGYGAYIGNSARYIGARLTVYVSGDGFRNLSVQGLDKVRERLAANGVRGLVSLYPPLNAAPGTWKDIGVEGWPRSLMVITEPARR